MQASGLGCGTRTSRQIGSFGKNGPVLEWQSTKEGMKHFVGAKRWGTSFSQNSMPNTFQASEP